MCASSLERKGVRGVMGKLATAMGWMGEPLFEGMDMQGSV